MPYQSVPHTREVRETFNLSPGESMKPITERTVRLLQTWAVLLFEILCPLKLHCCGGNFTTVWSLGWLLLLERVALVLNKRGRYVFVPITENVTAHKQ